MERFAFRLQKVLDHRIDIEDEKKRAFVKARREYLKEKDDLELLYQRLQESNSKTFEKNTGIFTYIARYNYITFLEERIEEQSKRLELFEKEMNQRKQEYEASRKDRKVIDRLRENAFNDYKVNVDRMEQKQNDEFALYGYVRNG